MVFEGGSRWYVVVYTDGTGHGGRISFLPVSSLMVVRCNNGRWRTEEKERDRYHVVCVCLHVSFTFLDPD